MSVKTMPKTKKVRCRKKAPFICPSCKSTTCTTDHWDAPMAEFSLCCFCGKRRRAQFARARKDACSKDSYEDHRPQCRRTAGHRNGCRG